MVPTNREWLRVLTVIMISIIAVIQCRQIDAQCTYHGNSLRAQRNFSGTPKWLGSSVYCSRKAICTTNTQKINHWISLSNWTSQLSQCITCVVVRLRTSSSLGNWSRRILIWWMENSSKLPSLIIPTTTWGDLGASEWLQSAWSRTACSRVHWLTSWGHSGQDLCSRPSVCWEGKPIH